MEYSNYRQFAYTLNISVHVLNIIYLCVQLSPLLYRPEFKILANVQPRFFTCWTFLCQILHAAVGLHCEKLLRQNRHRDDYKLPQKLRDFRDILFASFVWPSTWVTLIVFWTLCTYDKSLVFPFYTDKFVNPVSNHIMHTFIVPMAFLEVIYQRRRTPISHKKNLYYLLFFYMLYFFVGVTSEFSIRRSSKNVIAILNPYNNSYRVY
ncbi:unnamed protein product [Leptidea sinapis]|uniref:Androgen-dependent TFPI-regulating protein n=1 Tax=Leptidea sinapis TaxID=189913 RepID=A0A5E4Q9S4_9NEOP|nr:unnamed protein product [Leptidea sinapis]